MAKIYNVVCKICGKQFTANTARKTLCSEECKRENRIKNATEHNKKMKEIRRNARKEKEQRKTIVDIAVMARQAGMSYGQYSAMLMLQKESRANGI